MRTDAATPPAVTAFHGAQIRTQRAVDELVAAAQVSPVTCEQAIALKLIMPGEAHD